MTLGRLTRLGRSELDDEMQKLRETIAQLQAIHRHLALEHIVVSARFGAQLPALHLQGQLRREGIQPRQLPRARSALKQRRNAAKLPASSDSRISRIRFR